MVMLDLAAEGTYVAVRPSGTEPKVKYYMFTYEPAEQLANLEDTKAAACGPAGRPGPRSDRVFARPSVSRCANASAGHWPLLACSGGVQCA